MNITEFNKYCIMHIFNRIMEFLLALHSPLA